MSLNTVFGRVRTVGICARFGRSAVSDIIKRKPLFTSADTLLFPTGTASQKRLASSGNGDKDLSSIIHPVPVKPCNDPDGINVGAELTGALKKGMTAIFIDIKFDYFNDYD